MDERGSARAEELRTREDGPSDYLGFLQHAAVRDIHRCGGLASYNHLYGTSNPRIPLPAAKQDAFPRSAAVELIGHNAPDADILEVGYPMRAGVDIDRHTGLWDACALDLLVDNSCPMGSVTLSGSATRALRVTAAGVPDGGRLELVRGVVDYAGTANPVPTTAVVKTVPAGALSAGAVDVQVDTGQSSFVRSQVRDSGGGDRPVQSGVVAPRGAARWAGDPGRPGLLSAAVRT